MITNQQERAESDVNAMNMHEQQLPEPRTLTPAEILAVAGGPEVTNAPG